MDYKVKVRYVRIGRRKIGRLLPFVRGEYVQRAIANLKLMPQSSSVTIQKAVKSGIANAMYINRNLNPDTLWVKEAAVNAGPTIKRMKTRARGSANRIVKPFSHLIITLTDEAKPSQKDAIKKLKDSNKEETEKVKTETIDTATTEAIVNDEEVKSEVETNDIDENNATSEVVDTVVSNEEDSKESK